MDCDEEREGYVKPSAPAYPVIHATQENVAKRHGLTTRAQEGFGALLGITGALWAGYMVVVQQASPWHFQIVPPGPADICAVGALVWLHAKWRHVSRMR